MTRDYTIKPAVSEGRDSPDYGFTRLSDECVFIPSVRLVRLGKLALWAVFAAVAWAVVIPAVWAVWGAL